MPLEFKPIMPRFGAEVLGADLASLDEATSAAVLDGFHRFGLLVFRDQHLTLAQEVAFARLFPHGDGLPIYRDFTIDGFPEIQKLGNVEENGKPVAVLNKVGIEWHTDGTSRQYPCVATQLYAIEAPRSGGDTLYSSGYTAYELLPPDTRRGIRHLKVRYNYRNIMAKINAASGNIRSTTDPSGNAWQDVVHPLVRVHPVTQREALWVTLAEMETIEGMSPADSHQLVEELMTPGMVDEYVYAHKYRPGDMVVWDNRCMFHSTTPYNFAGQRRLLHRVALNGNEIPA
jgi:taurine dioxygenase